MSLFGNNGEEQNTEQKNTINEQHPEQEAKTPEQVEQAGAPSSTPENGNWGRTNQYGYGQGYQQPYNTNYAPPPQYPPNQGYGAYPPNVQYRPNQQYQYGANGGWQQPQQQQQRPQENYQWNFQDYEKASGAKTKKKRSRGLVVFVVSLICVISVGLIGLSAYGVYNYVSDDTFLSDNKNDGEYAASSESGQGTKLEIVSTPQINESLPVGGKMTIPQVAKAVSPSVVGVIQYQPDMYLEETGEGSGIILSADGYVITNAHVVAGGTAFKVILHDGTPKDAELIGADEQTDLAVLKILSASGLTPAVFGDSAKIEVGETVIAIGNPGGSNLLAGSVTQGIISAVDREVPRSSGGYVAYVDIPLIQTDAAINPGNSGGPLVNEYGQVIGINSAKIVAEGFEGIGFAIPVSVAKPIIDDIVTNGRVTGRVKLGIGAREIDEIDSRKTGLAMGIRIESIDPESDLAKQDVQRFDIITHIDGERVLTMVDLKTQLNKYEPGDTVTLTLSRPVSTTRSEEVQVTVTLMEDK